MNKINRSDIIGSDYPKGTGRQINIGGTEQRIKVALCGDSTIDNGHWVNSNQEYKHKSDTVAHQTACALATKKNSKGYEIANFSVDGATTTNMLKVQKFNEVIPADKDHPDLTVSQLVEIQKWSPEVAVLSVGGNNFRLALQAELPFILIPSMEKQTHLTFDIICSFISMLCHFTPSDKNIRDNLEALFKKVQKELYQEYKVIIDGLLKNGSTKRLVISSQYYPALTPASFYFIYTGFSHLAHAKGKGQSAFQVADEIMHCLYREVLEYAAQKDIEIVFADVTSSMSPLGGNLSMQIEPNEKGSKVIGQLMAEAIELEIPEDKKIQFQSFV